MTVEIDSGFPILLPVPFDRSGPRANMIVQNICDYDQIVSELFLIFNVHSRSLDYRIIKCLY